MKGHKSRQSGQQGNSQYKVKVSTELEIEGHFKTDQAENIHRQDTGNVLWTDLSKQLKEGKTGEQLEVTPHLTAMVVPDFPDPMRAVLTAESVAEPEDLYDREKLSTFLNPVRFTRTCRNLKIAFQDGVLFSEVVTHYEPKLIKRHIYHGENSMTGRKYNWDSINKNILPKLNMKLSADDIKSLCEAKPGVIDKVLWELRGKLKKSTSRRQFIRRPRSAPTKSVDQNGEPIASLYRRLYDGKCQEVSLFQSAVGHAYEKINELKSELESKETENKVEETKPQPKFKWLALLNFGSKSKVTNKTASEKSQP